MVGLDCSAIPFSNLCCVISLILLFLMQKMKVMLMYFVGENGRESY